MCESDRREPGLRTLTKLIEATGHKLSLALTPPTQDQLGLPDSPSAADWRRHRRTVTETLERAGAHNPRVFGSVARAEDAAASDIDLLVDLAATVGLVTLARLTRELTELLDAAVNIVPAAITNAFPPLVAAVARLLERLEHPTETPTFTPPLTTDHHKS